MKLWIPASRSGSGTGFAGIADGPPAPCKDMKAAIFMAISEASRRPTRHSRGSGNPETFATGRLALGGQPWIPAPRSGPGTSFAGIADGPPAPRKDMKAAIFMAMKVRKCLTPRATRGFPRKRECRRPLRQGMIGPTALDSRSAIGRGRASRELRMALWATYGYEGGYFHGNDGSAEMNDGGRSGFPRSRECRVGGNDGRTALDSRSAIWRGRASRELRMALLRRVWT